MAYKSVNPYNGKVLKTFDDMTDLDKALRPLFLLYSDCSGWC
jgi:hypothetical protein